MMLSVVLVMIAVIFAAQLSLCMHAKQWWVKLIPLGLICLGELVCGAAYILSVYLERIGEGIYGAAFAAVVYAVVLLIVLAADGLAWAIFGIVKHAQNRRK